MIQRRSLRIAALSSLLAVGLALLYSLREIFNPFLLSLLIAYVLNPVVDFCERLRVRRIVSIFCIYLLIGGISGILVLFAIPGLVNETVGLYNATFLGDEFIDLNLNSNYDPGVDTFYRDINGDGRVDPSYMEKLRRWAAGLIERWNQANPGRKIDTDVLLAKARDTLGGTPKEITSTGLDLTGRAVSLISSGVLGTLSLFSYVLLLPIYTFFLLRGMPTMKERIQAHLPGRYKPLLMRVGGRIHLAVSSFFRGKLIICLMKGVLTYLGLMLFDVRVPLLFGLIQATASLIPFLVLIVGLVPALGLVLLDYGVAWTPLLGALGVFLVAEALEGFLLTPWVLGKETGLHPVVLIMVLLMGAQLLGLFGLLLAVPLASIVGILADEFLLPQLRELAAEPPAE